MFNLLSEKANSIGGKVSTKKNRLIAKWKSLNGREELALKLKPIVAEIAASGMDRQKLLRKALLTLGYSQSEVAQFLKLKSRHENSNKDYPNRKTSNYVKKVGRSPYTGTVGGGAPGLGRKK